MNIVEQTRQLVEELSEAGQSLAHSAAEMASHAAEVAGESISAIDESIGSVFGQEAPKQSTADSKAADAAEVIEDCDVQTGASNAARNDTGEP